MDSSTFTSLQNFRVSLNNTFLERTDVIDGVIASIITEQSCFLFGAPGAGKSELVSKSLTVSAEVSSLVMLSRLPIPQSLRSGRCIETVEDEYTRDIKAISPITAFDELFRGSSFVLNSLLQVLNERTFNNGKELVQTKIKSVVAATNSFPTEESLQAFCDRFLFRPTIEGLKSPRANESFMAGRCLVNDLQWSRITIESLETLKTAKLTSEEFIDIFTECWTYSKAGHGYL